MLGLQRGIVQVIPYSPQWAALFRQEAERLKQALGAYEVDIQHIGSTSIPGLAAKPILDIGIAVAAEADVPTCVTLLNTVDYTYRGDRGASEGYFFDRGTGEQRTHYLHMLLISNPAWGNYLRFRDYLIAHPDSRDAYMRLKEALAVQYAEDRAAYTAAKAEFIQGILASAR